MEMQEKPLFGLTDKVEVANDWLELLANDPKEAPEAMRVEWPYVTNSRPYFSQVPVPPRYIKWNMANLAEYGTLDVLDGIAKGTIK